MSKQSFITQPLVQAIVDNDSDLVRKLAADDESLETADEILGPPLIAAIQDENADMVALLLELGANPNGPDSGDWDSPLSEAALSRDIDALKHLLAAGADPNIVRDDSTPLMSALIDNDVAIAKLLIESGADVFLTNRHGANAVTGIEECSKAMAAVLRSAARKSADNANLLDAVQVEAHDRVKTLAANASQEELDKAARIAMREGYVDVMRILIEAGLDPIFPDPDGHLTILHAAAGLADEDIFLELFLATGANPNVTATFTFIQEQPGMTPLMMAAQERSLSRVKMLLKAGADVTLRNEQGETALSLARKSGGKTIIKLLEKQLELVAYQTEASLSNVSLHNAVRDGDTRLVARILDNGSDANQKDQSGQTPLMEAIMHDDVTLLELLLDRGADPCLEWPRKGDATWAQALQQRSAVKLAQALLRSVDDPHQLAGSVYDDAAFGLWKAVFALRRKGAADITAMLIERGVDVNQRFNNGFTPLLLAAAHADAKTAEMIPVLLDAGADSSAVTEPNLPREKRRQDELDEMEARGLDVSSLRKRQKHEPLSAMALAKQGSKKVYNLLCELLGAEGGPRDRCDETDAVLAGFKLAAAEASFIELAEHLTERLQSKPKPWRRRAGVLQYTAKLKQLTDSEAHNPDGDELRCLEPIQSFAREQGATLVYKEIPGDARKVARVLLAPTTDWASVVRMCGTNGANYGLSTRDIINRLDELKREYTFELGGCGHDFVAVRFAPVSNYEALHTALTTFCPDLTDGSPDDAHELADFYARDGRCFLWWD